MKRRRVNTRIFFSLIIFSILIPLISCQKEPAPETRKYLLEKVEDFAVIQLYADGFEQLTPKQKILTYYLSEASIAGRDIFYDQNHRHGLEIRDLLEEIYVHREGIDPEVFNQMSIYLKLFWMNNGNYNDRSKQKFIPEFSFEELEEAARIARDNGADFNIREGSSLSEKLAKLRSFIFDSQFEPLVTNKSPKPPLDIISGSANNLYYGLALKDVEEFARKGKEKHALNSRLVKVDGKIKEEVYRSGNESIPPGRYAEEIVNIIHYLERALPYAEDAQAEAMKKLIRFYQTGEQQDWLDYNKAWVGYDPIVETINGFIETYKDARGQKGGFEGIVHIVNKEKTEILKKLAQKAAYFEEKMPWNDEYKKKDFQIPVANAVDVIMAAGDGGPMCSIGINLPNEQEIRQNYGSKSVSLQNVLESYSMATAEKAIEEFALPEERENAKKYGANNSWLKTSLHEILGHASGKVSEKLDNEPSFYLKEHDNALEEARADLAALYHIFDGSMIEMGALPDRKAAESAYRSYAWAGMFILRRVEDAEKIEDDHMRGLNLIVNYLKDKTEAVQRITLDGKAYYKVVDISLMRQGIAELLSEVMRIKAEGDYEGANELMKTYGIYFDKELRDEVVQRAKAAGIANYGAIVMPVLVPVMDEDGKIMDISISYSDDFAAQMLRYSGKLPNL
jgi:dipeptidyl-peptidase-3